jgi:V-type H+-transporting ATPase subunit D
VGTRGIAYQKTSFLALDTAIKTTNRRVNALENVVKPKLENTISYIKVPFPPDPFWAFTSSKHTFRQPLRAPVRNQCRVGEGVCDVGYGYAASVWTRCGDEVMRVWAK